MNTACRLTNVALRSVLLINVALRLAQGAPAISGSTYIQCGTLFDVKSGSLRSNVLIEVQGKTIKDIREAAAPPSGGAAKIISLPKETCLPGLIDAYVHFFMQDNILPGRVNEQLLRWSPAYRSLRAAHAARLALSY